jgi:hypothetical protein
MIAITFERTCVKVVGNGLLARAPEEVDPVDEHRGFVLPDVGNRKRLAYTVGFRNCVSIHQGHGQTIAATPDAHRLVEIRQSHDDCAAGASRADHQDTNCAIPHEVMRQSVLNARGLGFAQILRGPRNGERLSGQRLAQKLLKSRRDWVLRTLQGRVGFEDALGEQGAKMAQIFKGRLHGDTSCELGHRSFRGSDRWTTVAGLVRAGETGEKEFSAKSREFASGSRGTDLPRRGGS